MKTDLLSKPSCRRTCLFCLPWVVLLALWINFGCGVSRGATLLDFGYQHMSVNGKVSLGQRALAVILVEFAEANELAHPVAWYDDYFFNLARTPRGVNAAFFEMSNRRFFWSRGTTVGPVKLPAAQRYGNLNPNLAEGPLRDQLYASNIIYQAWAGGFVNFANYDANGNGHVANDELQIAIVYNDVDVNGAARWAGTVRGPGAAVDWTGEVAEFGHLTDFATVVHELSHTLGTLDLYGVGGLSYRLTLMGNTGCSPPCPENPAIFHLDPWHKMQLGWCEPRIYSLRAGGIATMAAAQMANPGAPIILYDPARGTGEFFMLEYRTETSPNGPGYDASVGGNGLVIWHIQQDANHNPVLLPNRSRIVWSEGAPNLARGGSDIWGSGSTSPYLRWLDGTESRTRLHVRPFNTGTGSITVEWWAEEDVWVDFNYFSFLEDGTFIWPFNTLAEGVNAVPYGGAIKFKTGSSAETALISKRMTLQTYNGPVLIGR